jgi:regulator of replication initiation timing
MSMVAKLQTDLEKVKSQSSQLIHANNQLQMQNKSLHSTHTQENN